MTSSLLFRSLEKKVQQRSTRLRSSYKRKLLSAYFFVISVRKQWTLSRTVVWSFKVAPGDVVCQMCDTLRTWKATKSKPVLYADYWFIVVRVVPGVRLGPLEPLPVLPDAIYGDSKRPTLTRHKAATKSEKKDQLYSYQHVSHMTLFVRLMYAFKCLSALYNMYCVDEANQNKTKI